jgi:hypothetical protein
MCRLPPQPMSCSHDVRNSSGDRSLKKLMPVGQTESRRARELPNEALHLTSGCGLLAALASI